MALDGRKYVLSAQISDDNECHTSHRDPSQRALVVSRRIIKTKSVEENV